MQTTFRLGGPSPNARTWIFVVDESATPDALAERELLSTHAALAMEAMATRPDSRWVDVNVRASVVGARQKTTRRPSDDPGLAWREADASRAGATAFSDAVAAAARSLPNSDAPLDVVAAIASVARDTKLPSQRIAVVPRSVDTAAVDRALDGLVDQVISIDEIGGAGALTSVILPCPPRPIVEWTATVYLSEGTCDPSRGLRPAQGRAPLDAELDGRTACAVDVLDGDAERACASGANGRSLPGGICLWTASPKICPRPMPRLVGGALPPGAVAEIIYNLQ